MVRFASILAACATLVSTASAFALADDFDAMLLIKRQEGDPSYDCHADCGFSIRGAREPNYCGNQTWIDWYNGCMECAVAQNIWSMYGNSVGSAAQACGLSGVPVGLESNGTASASASASATGAMSSAAGSASAATSSASSVASSLASAASSAAGAASSAASSAAAAATQTGSSAVANTAHAGLVLGLAGVMAFFL